MMTIENEVRITTPSLWRSRIIFALLISICFVGLMLATGLLWRTFLNEPPITLRSLDPRHLGSLCPGEVVPIRNQITVHDDVIVHYFVSVLDEGSNVNFPGTQRAYTDFLHPHPASFGQRLDWEVPFLPSGDYSRVFAVRKVSGNEDTVFIIANFTIGELNCQ